MKVTLLCFVRRGGMVHYTAQLANALAELTEVEVVVADCVDPAYFDSRVVLRQIMAGTSGKDTALKLLSPGFYHHLRQTLKNVQGQVVHITAFHPWNILLAFLCPRPLALTVHDPIQHSGERWYVKHMSNFVISQCRLLFVHDQAGQKVLQQQAPDVRVTMVPHGPYSLFATNTSGQKSAKIFLFFGRIEEYKGIATLLQAWPQVAQTLPDWKLIIAGQGDLTPYADQLQTSSIEVRNYYLADDEVAELFGQAGVVVLPYHDATQSGVLMIAAAMAKPIIASRVGAIPQVVIDGQSGMLVSPGSVSELANAMIYAGSNLSAVQSFGHQLQHSTSQVGDWIEAARRHQVAYKTILP